MLWDWKVYGLDSWFAEQVRQAETEAGRVYEPVIGIITDNKDPLKLGRVKLKFPVISMDDVTDWTPIIMQGAGKNRGWFFIPEIDDEVLVVFEHGDIDRPLVVGALWNGKDKPHDSNPDPGENAHRVIKSRQGSRVFFDDSDENKVYIEDGTGKGRITLDAKNNKIIIEAIDGDVCFQSPQDDTKIVAKEIELKAQQNIEIHAGSTMTWGSDKEAKINGGGGVTMTGSNVNLNCGQAQQPAMPSASPEEVKDPYGS
jgi:uncharacterized protein involved in type VI secretion and phage assembly